MPCRYGLPRSRQRVEPVRPGSGGGDEPPGPRHRPVALRAANDARRNPLLGFSRACTHANPLVLCPSPRNKSDEIIAELAARGGVIGAAGWAPILHRGTRRRPKLSDLADCIDHVVRLVGPDHASVGSDLCDDLTPTPESWEPSYGPSGSFPEVTAGLGDWYCFDTNMAEGLDTIAQMPKVADVVRGRRGVGRGRQDSGLQSAARLRDRNRRLRNRTCRQYGSPAPCEPTEPCVTGSCTSRRWGR